MLIREEIILFVLLLTYLSTPTHAGEDRKNEEREGRLSGRYIVRKRQMVDTEKSSKAEQFMKKIVDRSGNTNNTRDGIIRIKWRQLDNIQGHVDKDKVIKVKQQRKNDENTVQNKTSPLKKKIVHPPR